MSIYRGSWAQAFSVFVISYTAVLHILHVHTIYQLTDKTDIDLGLSDCDSAFWESILTL